MATITDVCALAGVSKATVSRVINGSEQVKPKTREAVHAAMRQLGYQPNTLAQALATNTSHSIGLVLPHFESSYFGSVLHHAEQETQKAGKKLLVVNSKNSAAGEREAVETLAAQRCDAVLLYSRHLSQDELVGLQQKIQRPLLILNRRLTSPYLYSFGLDQQQVTSLAMDHLLSLGHRQIACIASPLQSETGKIRFHGYQKALQDKGIAVSTDLVIESNNTLAGGYEAMNELLQTDETFTAVFASNDDMALGAMRALYDHGKKVPSDIAVIGIDNEPAAAYAIPSLSTVSLPIVTLSKDATLCALKLANKETVPVEHRVYQSELVIRESTSKQG
ncbi:LacI family transcriptional regulator [Vibrio navarrensis]|uniref:LacI family transcriptional regulator n=1 Tax=Vibrio navarrensis TaxID=29495 RepID=A0A099LUD6_9VIBR|nr:LacI family DNA-binding transcriptional regulator [Vibrio navarrensis]KGK11274.1 LacI family transcriptional regulator [Vibrio navarrensis]KGK17827.1 LacI family transcriptional regulator [Vibrio navarrensis]MBE4575393.1 LacI family transcriptional regulator [Vibrio navarrensis]MBE4576561.1 LacI family transcriptional regulator [Vibrio navarrensis]MBE4586463.1 LacI family transcriptional regulator [Vibrio navarrensis]